MGVHVQVCASSVWFETIQQMKKMSREKEHALAIKLLLPHRAPVGVCCQAGLHVHRKWGGAEGRMHGSCGFDRWLRCLNSTYGAACIMSSKYTAQKTVPTTICVMEPRSKSTKKPRRQTRLLISNNLCSDVDSIRHTSGQAPSATPRQPSFRCSAHSQ